MPDVGPFDHVKLNTTGTHKSEACRQHFRNMETMLIFLCGGSNGGRELSLMRTKLQEAAFWCQKAISLSSENREE